MKLSQEAWQLLMSHTEHHLLSAYQTLWRLSYLFAPQLMANSDKTTENNISKPATNVALDVKDLQAALVNDAQFSVFDLSDA
ncbi:DNA polymerase III subunit delta, partial [Psychrobacter sp. 1U2]